MKAFWAHVIISLKLTARDRMVLFFNYAFPLIFFFFFGAVTHADRGGAAVYVVSLVITMGVLGNGFFGAGLRAAMDREQNILRRFRVAPITPAPILFSTLATGFISYLPAVTVILALAHTMWGMPLPNLLNFYVFIAISLLAFRSLGLIVASSVNSMQESQLLVQLLYVPMLLLSIMPMSELPVWAQVATQFVPAGYLQQGIQGILIRNEGLVDNASAIGALLLTAALGTFISLKLFRWDKDDKVRPAAKLWIVAVLTPFLILGLYQTRTREALAKAKMIERSLATGQNLLIRDVRIFVGDGKVIESGSVLIKNGKIQQIFEGEAPDGDSLKAETIGGAGKTVLPGLADVDVHLSTSGGLSSSAVAPDMRRELAAYLYSGVMSVRSAGDPLDAVLKIRASVETGERQGAGLFICGTVRSPASVEEAQRQVRELKARGVQCIETILYDEQRLDVNILTALAAAAQAQSLPLAVRTSNARDVAEAVSAGANSIEHRSLGDAIPDDLFTRMRARNIAYEPSLAAAEADRDRIAGSLEPLERPLVQQVIPPALLKSTRQFIASKEDRQIRELLKGSSPDPTQGRRNLLRAFQLGVTLVTGTGSGTPLLFHGPAVHREMQLWVEAGLPAPAVLQAATYNAARLLGAVNRSGLIQAGYDANLIMVEGNPLKDIQQSANISLIILKGERIRRSSLFEE